MLSRVRHSLLQPRAALLQATAGKARAFHRSSPLFALVKKPFLLADIGEGITECEIVKWLVEKDQVVEEFDPVVEVMSDKATVEITSPYSGKILHLNGAVGEVIRVGKQLLEVEVEDGSAEAQNPSKETEPSSPTETSAPPPSQSKSSPFKEVHSERSRGEVLATPSTRRIARESGISLSSVTGTGRDGRVTKSDVLGFVKNGNGETSSTTATVSSPLPVPTTESSPPASTSPKADPIPLSSLRKAMFKSMTSSLSIPHFGYSEVLDITELERLRVLLNERIPLEYRKTLTEKEQGELERKTLWTGGNDGANVRVAESHRFDKITLMPLLLKAMGAAMDQHPIFKCLLSPSASSGSKDEPHLLPQPSTSISVAFSASPEGLFLPTIASVSSLSPFAIASQLSHLASITPFSPPPANRAPASFTLSNIGAIGGRTTLPVIPPVSGQLGIVAIGRQRVEEVYLPGQEKAARQAAIEGRDGSELKRGPRVLLDATFSADHRVVEGVELARFAETWKRIVEAPGLLSGLGS